MLIKKCLQCNKEFRTFPSAIKRNGGKFCCPKCMFQNKEWREKIRKTLKGHKHSNKTKIKMRETHKRINNKPPVYKGKNHWNWKGGIKNFHGYIYIWKPNHPYCNQNYIPYSHLVVEKILKRYLIPTELVHHINEIKDDNRPENLYLFSNKNEHTKYHTLVKNDKIEPITQSNLPLP